MLVAIEWLGTDVCIRGAAVPFGFADAETVVEEDRIALADRELGEVVRLGFITKIPVPERLLAPVDSSYLDRNANDRSNPSPWVAKMMVLLCFAEDSCGVHSVAEMTYFVVTFFGAAVKYPGLFGIRET